MAHARGDVPVDGADVVAGLVLADLLEGDAGALEDGVILAAEQVLDGALRLQLQTTNLTNDLARQHERFFLRLAATRSGAPGRSLRSAARRG